MCENILKSELWDMLRIATTNLESVFKPIIMMSGLTMMQIRILIAITECEDMKVSEISKLLEISSGNASNMCKKMEREGYISRMRSSEDERVVELEPTQKGIEVADNILKEIKRRFNPILYSKPKEDIELIINGIKKLNELFEEFEVK